jgi:hypothetical protein
MKFPEGVTWHSSRLTEESVNRAYYNRLSGPRFMPGCEGIHGLKGGGGGSFPSAKGSTFLSFGSLRLEGHRYL